MPYRAPVTNDAAFTSGQILKADDNASSCTGVNTTGSGNVVLATSPTLVTPALGVPTALDLLNATDLPAPAVNAGALANGMTATTQAAGDNTTKLATDAFVHTEVANAVAGVNPAVAVQAATTAAADTSGFTYNNGVAGIGATLTGPTANVAVTIDGFTFTALGQRLLVKNDTQSPSGAFNGVYYVTTLQAPLIKPVLTRALDYDTPSDINNTGAIPVVNGTANALTSWLLTSAVNTVGTDPLTYSKFSLNPAAISTANLTDYATGTWTPTDGSGAGLTFTSATCTYHQLSSLVHLHVQFTYPNTADGSNAAVSGLPFTVASGGFALVFCSVFGGAMIQANLVNNKLFFFNFSTLVRLTNANLSLNGIVADIFYGK